MSQAALPHQTVEDYRQKWRAHVVDQRTEKIEKRRRIQIGIYVGHLGLLIGGLVYFVLIREMIFAVITGLFSCFAVADLLSRTGTIRAPMEKLRIPSIDWNLRGLDWLMGGLLVGLTVVEGIALIVIEPDQVWALWVWIPLFLTMALAPLVVFGWMFDRSSRGVLFTFVRSGFRFPPPEDEYWNEVRASHQEIRDVSLVFIVFEACCALQFLMMGIWAESVAILLLWAILVTSVLKGMPLTRKAEPVPFPPSS